MQFDDPVVAGASLVRVAIQSADYLQGVRGWRIARNGDVEFNSGDFRGDVVVTAADGTQVTIRAGNGSAITFRPPTAVFNPNADLIGSITSGVSLASGTPNSAFLTMTSPTVNDVSRVSAELSLYSEPDNGIPFSGMRYSHGLATVGIPALKLTDLRVSGDTTIDGEVNVGDRLSVAGRDIGRGLVDVVDASTTTGAISTSETITLISNFVTFKSGRAYEAHMKGGVRGQAANTYAQFRIRKDTITGQDLGEFYRIPTGPSTFTPVNGAADGVIFRVTGSDVTCQVALTCIASALGNVDSFATSATPRQLRIYDIGRASYFPNNPGLV